MTKTLTEQWREGTLPEGWYYLKVKSELANYPVIAECVINYSSLKPYLDFYEYDDSHIEEVLSPVPDYYDCKGLIYASINMDKARKRIDELVSKTEQLEKKLEIATKALKKLTRDCNKWGVARKALKEIEGGGKMTEPIIYKNDGEYLTGSKTLKCGFNGVNAKLTINSPSLKEPRCIKVYDPNAQPDYSKMYFIFKFKDGQEAKYRMDKDCHTLEQFLDRMNHFHELEKENKRLQEQLEIATKALEDCYNDMKYWAVLTHRNQRILSVIKKALKEMEGVK